MIIIKNNGGEMREKALYFVLVLVIILVIGCSETTSPESTKPSNLQITLVEENIIKLTWQDNSTDENKFFIDRKKGEYEWFENYFEVEENITTCTDEIPTESDTIYSYRVRAFDGSDYTEYSTSAGWFSESSAPSNLQLEQVAQDSIKLMWNDNSIGEYNFRIDRKIEGEEWIENYKTLDANIVEFIDYNNDLYAPCYYRIIAICGNSSSNYCESNLNAFNPPSNLNATLFDYVAISLEWVDNSNYEIGYIIERKKENEEFVLLDSVDQNINTYIDDNIEEFTKYYYRIYGFNQEFQTNYSNIANATWYNGIIYVPDYFDEIQNAINIAHSGDTIIVRSGQYFENIELQNKNIVLASEYLLTGDENDISQTIINGSNSDTVIRINWSINDSTLICGFTINEGYANYNGGGIYCDGNPILSNLIITSNHADYDGGGIYCSGSPQLQYLTINSNTAGDDGGGIYFYDGNPILENSEIYYNSSYSGGGLFISSDIVINNTIIRNNSSNYSDSGVFCNNSNASFNNVIIKNNYGDYAINISNSDFTFINSIIDNTLMQVSNSNAQLINCIVDNDYIDIINQTIMDISYSDIIGGEIIINVNYNSTLNWLEGNIDLDPLFVNPDNYHLQLSSPCIDAGNPNTQYNDYDGSRNDMGAYGGPSGEW